MGMLAPAEKFACNVHQCDRPAKLQDIRKAGCAAAIWERTPDQGFQKWIDTFDPGQLPSGRLATNPHRVEAAVNALCEQASLPRCHYSDTLASDISALAVMYSQIMRLRNIRVRLDVISDNACAKFHIDHVSARLLCTYRGTGTEYGLAQNGQTPDKVDRLGTGSVGLFRGTQWPSREQTALVHRSPPVTGSDAVRLLLVIDPAG